LPTKATIVHIANREGLGELNEPEWDFVWDLLAKAGGAQVAEFDKDAAMLDAEIYGTLESEALLQRHPHLNKSDVYENMVEEYHHLQHQLHHLLEQLDLNEIPGYNHAAKAVRVVKLLRHAKLRWAMDLLVIYSITALFDALEAAITEVKSLSPEALQLLAQFVEPNDDVEDSAELLGIELALAGLNLPELTRIARQLDEISELRSKTAKPYADPDGEDVGLRPIRDIGELGRAGQSTFALPETLRNARAAMGDLDIREPQSRRDKKQLLFSLVDGSDSMLWYGALGASRAAGVIMNRLRAVIDGEAEVYLRFFDHTFRAKEYHAKDAASARELMRIVADSSQYRGGTNFSKALSGGSDRVLQLMSQGTFRLPELMFVTDGDAMVPDISVLQGVKMHAVQVGAENVDELSELARQSGGIAKHVALGEM
jgi:Mg-chelatase subunit ChlD